MKIQIQIKKHKYWPLAEGFVRFVSETNTVEFFDKYKCPTGLMMSCLQLTSISHQPDFDWKTCQTFWRIEGKRETPRTRKSWTLSQRKGAVFIPMLINDEESDRRLRRCRLEIVRSVKTVWETSPIDFHSSHISEVPRLGVPFTGLR